MYLLCKTTVYLKDSLEILTNGIVLKTISQLGTYALQTLSGIDLNSELW